MFRNIKRFYSNIKLQYISDLHLDYHKAIPKITPIKNSYLALLGDIGNPYGEKYKEFMNYASDNWKKVYLITGNHEYFDVRKKYNPKEVDVQISNVVNNFNNISFLNNTVETLGKYKILGTTLWTPHTNSNKYSTNVHWIETEMYKNKNSNLILLTHHLPSYKLIIDKYKKYNSANRFASDLEYLMRPPIKYWICGHSHCLHKVNINGVPCMINTYGTFDINYDNIHHIELS